jgi:nucleotide-binding universal stress UspA family protein
MSAPLPPPPSAEVYVPFEDYGGLTAEAQRQLTAVANGIADLPIETRVLVGSPGPAIVETAKAVQADLIVMGTHGRSGLMRVLMGSVAEYVLRHALCPVLTIKPTTREHLSHVEETDLVASESA